VVAHATSKHDGEENFEAQLTGKCNRGGKVGVRWVYSHTAVLFQWHRCYCSVLRSEGFDVLFWCHSVARKGGARLRHFRLTLCEHSFALELGSNSQDLVHQTQLIPAFTTLPGDPCSCDRSAWMCSDLYLYRSKLRSSKQARNAANSGAKVTAEQKRNGTKYLVKGTWGEIKEKSLILPTMC
jgi:hypothetical protein